MADEKREDTEDQREERPKRTTQSGRRFGRQSYELEQPKEPYDGSALNTPLGRITGERRRVG